MTRLVGLSSAAFYGKLETEDGAAEVLKFPADFVEVFLESPSEYNRDFGRMVRDRIGELPVSSIHVKNTHYEGDLFGASPRQRRDAIAGFTGAMEAGQALGATYYVFHGPPVIRSVVRPTELQRMPDVLPQMIDIAGEHGITILWENVSWCTLRTPDEAAELHALFPQLGFVLDLKQAMECGIAFSDMIQAMGAGLRHLHALDRTADGRLCLPGEGAVDFPALRQCLDAADYRGGVLLEPYGYMTDDSDKLAASLNYLRKVFT